MLARRREESERQRKVDVQDEEVDGVAVGVLNLSSHADSNGLRIDFNVLILREKDVSPCESIKLNSRTAQWSGACDKGE